MRDKWRTAVTSHVDHERDPEWKQKDPYRSKKRDPKRPGEGLNREEAYPDDTDEGSRR
jgi:hypothetical protein